MASTQLDITRDKLSEVRADRRELVQINQGLLAQLPTYVSTPVELTAGAAGAVVNGGIRAMTEGSALGGDSVGGKVIRVAVGVLPLLSSLTQNPDLKRLGTAGAIGALAPELSDFVAKTAKAWLGGAMDKLKQKVSGEPEAE